MAGVTVWVFTLCLVVPCLAQNNLALNKAANQTGTYGTYGGQTADRAVDGLYDRDHCAHPDNPTGQGAEWWVDLRGTYRVQRIIIYNTVNSGGSIRLTNFVLSVGPTLSSRTDCGPEYTDVVGRGRSVNISCDQTGRFVHFRRVGGDQPHYVSLCEVEVYGQKFYDCSLCPLGVDCTQDSGCNQCDPGKIPPACSADCPDGVYGINCTSPCGRCVSQADCQPVDGVCSQGCQLWWAGDTCATEIVRPDRTTEAHSIGDVTNSSIQVTWQQITRVPRDYRSYYSYIISYKRSSDSSYIHFPPVAHTASEYNSAVITGLEYYREYNIRITPYREMDGQRLAGAVYPTVAGRTACGYPDPPSGVSGSNVVDGNGENIMIRWNVATDSNKLSRCSGKSAVRVEYRLVGTTEWSQESVDLTATELIITPPGGTYQLRVVLVNDEGLATASDIQTVTIQVGADFGIGGSGVTSGGNNTVTIAVSVVAGLLIIAVTVIVSIVLVLRHRRSRLNAENKELPTYVDQLKANASPGLSDKASEPVDYEDVTAVAGPVVPRPPPARDPVGAESPYDNVEAPVDTDQDTGGEIGKHEQPTDGLYTSLQPETRVWPSVNSATYDEIK